MDSLAYLEGARRSTLHPVYVVYGDEAFLKRQVVAAVSKRVFGDGGDDFSFSAYPGDKAEFSAVRNELETTPFLCSHRLVLVDNADPFVTRFRQALEAYVVKPAEHGILVLDVKTWPSNTRLSKLVPADATLECKALPAARVTGWGVGWTSSRYGKKISSQAVRLLVDLVGTDMGVLDQELGKLAIYVGPASAIDTADVDRLVGHSRAENTFKIFDAIGEGRTGDALTMLDRLFDQGEDPIRILGAFSFHLRRLAQLARLTSLGRSMTSAMAELQMPPFARQRTEQQLRQLGPCRLASLHQLLLQLDTGLKGGSMLSPCTQFERLVVELARPQPPESRIARTPVSGPLPARVNL